jgi:alkylation response protein AidB-like acyl-CoA dehydrogenase
MSTSFEAAKLLVLKAAFMKQKYEEGGEDTEQREAVDLAITKGKYFASNASLDAADKGSQVVNAAGRSLNNRCARHFADARVSIIFEGANEILEQKIALGPLGKDFQAYS